MKKLQYLLIVYYCLVTIPASGQVQQSEKDPILLTDICVENICFGDSISKILFHFGEPDTVIHNQDDSEEFAEPNNMMYWYENLVFYEILYSNLAETKGLFYGCIVRKNGAFVSIREVDLIIGETTIETVMNNLAQSIKRIDKPNDKEQYIFLHTTLPHNLKGAEGAFIRGIILFFTNNILIGIETYFDLN